MPHDPSSPRSRGARFLRVQPALAMAAAGGDDDLRLSVLAARAGLSPFQLHRMFSTIAAETPKQYARRLRVSRGAALLLTTEQRVLDIALDCGFASHETFTRSFRRQLGLSPHAYRLRGFTKPADAGTATAHATFVRQVAPCVRLFHLRPDGRTHSNPMSYDIVKKQLPAQPVLVVRRRVGRSDIASAIGEALSHIFEYAERRGLALSGHPFTRYIDAGPGLLTIEPGMRIAGTVSIQPSSGAAAAASDAAVIEDSLPPGPAATTVHAGSYETLADAYAAIESWMQSSGETPAGAPWESYITDPAEHPDPKDWRTEVCWPLK